LGKSSKFWAQISNSITVFTPFVRLNRFTEAEVDESTLTCSSTATVRFKLSYRGKSISYSADAQFDPKIFTTMLKDGLINSEREMSLRQFLFDW
jgi:hypothetical protein